MGLVAIAPSSDFVWRDQVLAPGVKHRCGNPTAMVAGWTFAIAKQSPNIC